MSGLIALRAKYGQWSYNGVGVYGWLQIGGREPSYTSPFEVMQSVRSPVYNFNEPVQEMAAYVQRDREDSDRRDLGMKCEIVEHSRSCRDCGSEPR